MIPRSPRAVGLALATAVVVAGLAAVSLRGRVDPADELAGQESVAVAVDPLFLQELDRLSRAGRPLDGIPPRLAYRIHAHEGRSVGVVAAYTRDRGPKMTVVRMPTAAFLRLAIADEKTDGALLNPDLDGVRPAFIGRDGLKAVLARLERSRP